MLIAKCLLYFVASQSCYQIVMEATQFAGSVCRQYMLCKAQMKLAICTEFVNYCEFGRQCFSVLHFELRHRGTSFNLRAIVGSVM